MAWWGVEVLRSAIPEDVPRAGNIAVDLRVLAATAMAAIVTGIAFGLAPVVQFARPTLSTELSDDFESAPDVTATETLTRLVVNGSLLLHLTRLTFAGGKGVPFVLGGGGYIRELHEKNEVVETGHEYHAGAGLHLWYGQGKHRVGLRGDFGVSWRRGGADATDVQRAVSTAGVSLAYLF